MLAGHVFVGVRGCGKMATLVVGRSQDPTIRVLDARREGRPRCVAPGQGSHVPVGIASLGDPKVVRPEVRDVGAVGARAVEYGVGALGHDETWATTCQAADLSGAECGLDRVPTGEDEPRAREPIAGVKLVGPD